VLCTAQNGDVNADSQVNLADAVTILGHLFLGGPVELVPLCVPESTAGLPGTGQSKCYRTDGAGGEIACDDPATCPGQDGVSRTGCPAAGRFTDNGDGTVLDTCTGLEWQKDTADASGDGRVTALDSLRWCEALSFAENLSFAGHDDWRLPNVRELQSITDYGRLNPGIDPAFGALPDPYWSSTTYLNSGGFAWVVNFFDSDVHYGGKTTRAYVRAVRGGG
jgi:hypothetical protein